MSKREKRRHRNTSNAIRYRHARKPGAIVERIIPNARHGIYTKR